MSKQGSYQSHTVAINGSLIIPWDIFSHISTKPLFSDWCPKIIALSLSLCLPSSCWMSKQQNCWPNAEAQQTIVPLFMGLFVSGCPVLVTPSALKGQSKQACILRLKSLAAVTIRAGLGFVLLFYMRCSDVFLSDDSFPHHKTLCRPTGEWNSKGWLKKTVSSALSNAMNRCCLPEPQRLGWNDSKDMKTRYIYL